MDIEGITWAIVLLYLVMFTACLVCVCQRILRDDGVIEDIELGPLPQRRRHHTVWIHRAIIISLNEKRNTCHETE